MGKDYVMTVTVYAGDERYSATVYISEDEDGTAFDMPLTGVYGAYNDSIEQGADAKAAEAVANEIESFYGVEYEDYDWDISEA